jgi:hypothetical protein
LVDKLEIEPGLKILGPLMKIQTFDEDPENIPKPLTKFCRYQGFYQDPKSSKPYSIG